MGEIYSITARDNSPLLKMWEVYVPPGDRPLRRHNHLSFEISLIREGGGIYTVGDRTYPFEKGSLFVFHANEEHCITRVEGGGLVLVNLWFEPKYLWGNSMDSLSEESIHLAFSRNPDFSNKIPPEDTTPLLPLFLRIEEDLQKKPKEYALTVKSNLNLLLVSLIRDFHYTREDSSLSRDKLHAIRRGISYIDAHLTESISLSDIAHYAGMSPHYFSTVFHLTSGLPLWDYIHAKRIEKALHLLHTEDTTILDIALLCGFNNTAHFNKIFKRQMGVTPKEYRSSVDILR